MKYYPTTILNQKQSLYYVYLFMNKMLSSKNYFHYRKINKVKLKQDNFYYTEIFYRQEQSHWKLGNKTKLQNILKN